MIVRADELGPELEQPTTLDIGLDDLDALARDLQPPVLRVGLREIFVECGEPVSLRLQHLPTRYSVRSKLSRTTESSGLTLAGRMDSKRSSSEPCLRNLLEKPA